MEENTENIELIQIIVLQDGTAEEKNSPHAGSRFKIEEVLLGVGPHRKPVPYSKGDLMPNGQFRARVLPNGRLRIIGNW
jgi:hypothetical protein